MSSTRDERFLSTAADLRHNFDGELQIGGNYTSTQQHGQVVYVSGQIPRVGSTVVVTGRVGADVSLGQARTAAAICAMRCLALLRQRPGGLDGVTQVLRMTVHVQCSAEFTQHSEVADAASAVLCHVLGSAGVHTRTSVGAFQLPKNAAVELDLIVAVAHDLAAIGTARA